MREVVILIKNAVGRELPEMIGTYQVRPFAGIDSDCSSDQPVMSNRRLSTVKPGEEKLQPGLKAAVEASGLKDGMTISFHHSFREGDQVIGRVLSVIKELGIKGLKFAPSAVVNIKNPSIVDYVKDGTIFSIEASGIRGELGDAVLEGVMDEPVILRPHGARPRAIEAGELSIDVAFIGASAADDYGNATGLVGPNACGALGYSFIDAMTAGKVIVITDHLVEYPCIPISISQEYVDYVVVVDSIGDTAKIGAGAARVTKNPRDLLIAKRAVEVMAASRRFTDGFVFQTGAGAISIACTKYLEEKMEERGVKASMALGGIPAAIVEMHEKGLVRTVACSQSFDAVAAKAIVDYPGIIEIDNSLYANPARKGCMLNRETFGILAALEVDIDFNVNILTGSNGEMMGGLGGGPDVAAGAQISIVVLPIVRGRIPSVVKKVFTCCTPGNTVAVVITEAGIALNPNHKNYQELKEDLEKTSLKLVTIEELRQTAEGLTGTPKPIECTDKITCIVEYRDGTVLDVIREIKKQD
ncbi:citrate lyase subunit alpha [[Clostridium] symbiosum]|uniref:Citrate lyase alpha chain n=1 Tax=Clostridium symbiosum TaxID=1512 RepID=A0AAW5F7Q6_CLOSY|nr:citrate lyase subunit alpha [[Clostridium] symbiosum]MCK0087927.1 citrate lyase subunit alpha [[Clostridium] symbiosum]